MASQKLDINISLNCPICKNSLQMKNMQFTCIKNHIFNIENGVCKLMDPVFKNNLDNYLKDFNQFRLTKIKPLKKCNVNHLPYVKFDKPIWKSRQYDLQLIKEQILTQKKIKILDYGAWNGWLSHNLSALGHEVTAIDYFTAPFDGLETVQLYNNKFLAIQAFIEDLSIFQSKFDLIIINRCIAHFSSLEIQLKDFKKLLNPYGKIIITGIIKTNKPIKSKNRAESANINFKKIYKKSLYLNSSKGYIDKNDLNTLKEKKFKLKRYKMFLHKSLLSKTYLTDNDYIYAIYHKKTNE